MVVNYVAPTVTGGTPPVNVTCAPVSGSTFGIGSTPVNCSAADSIGRTAVCSATVTVAGHQLAAQKIVAFGDSITAGENGLVGNNTGIAPGCSSFSSTSAATAPSVIPQFIDVQNSYPSQLQKMLQAAFAPAPTVANLGVPGETAANGEGRLKAALPTCAPNVLLLLEGINDLESNFNPPTMAAVVQNLRDDIDNARAAGVTYIFVGTLLPQRNCVSNGTAVACNGSASNNPGINAANDQIKAMVSGEGATSVDVNAAYVAADPTLASLISTDGLHPTVAGNAVTATAFYKAIVAKIPLTSVRLNSVRR
jgi:lysophospholipase L1-like esterase